MPKPRKATVTKQRTVHMYAELWHASLCVLEKGVSDERGSSWQFLSSAVLTAFAFEAYLNHVGPTVLACWAQVERLPPLAKFELLCERLSVRFPGGSSARPLQTVFKLFEFRNTVAHGRSVEVVAKPELRDINDKLDAQLGEMPRAKWERLVRTAAFARRSREDVQAVLEQLHQSRPMPKEGLFTFGLGSHGAKLA